MGDLSDNFSRSEFECKCGCGFNTVDTELLHVLEVTRQEFDRKTKITSGCRCEPWNIKVGGKINSKHLIGQAADIQVNGVSPEKVFRFLSMRYNNKYGIGNNKEFTHLDVRPDKARWRY